ncbi:universal stress protein [Modestobacter marinus]|uniref:universal stress protein n=1 Tax=Modestobacter marinus TaxID=477641 RepID=UPI003132E1A4
MHWLRAPRSAPAAPPGAPRARRPWLVVGVGPTAEGRGAPRWASREAARRDGTVPAVTGWPGGSAAGHAGRAAELVARVREAVEETGGHGRTRVQLLTGPVAEVLTASSEDADVLVLGQHHRTAP